MNKVKFTINTILQGVRLFILSFILLPWITILGAAYYETNNFKDTFVLLSVQSENLNHTWVNLGWMFFLIFIATEFFIKFNKKNKTPKYFQMATARLSSDIEKLEPKRETPLISHGVDIEGDIYFFKGTMTQGESSKLWDAFKEVDKKHNQYK